MVKGSYNHRYLHNKIKGVTMKDWTQEVNIELVKQILEELERNPSTLSPNLNAYRNKLRKIKENFYTV